MKEDSTSNLSGSKDKLQNNPTKTSRFYDTSSRRNVKTATKPDY